MEAMKRLVISIRVGRTLHLNVCSIDENMNGLSTLQVRLIVLLSTGASD